MNPVVDVVISRNGFEGQCKVQDAMHAVEKQIQYRTEIRLADFGHTSSNVAKRIGLLLNIIFLSLVCYFIYRETIFVKL